MKDQTINDDGNVQERTDTLPNPTTRAIKRSAYVIWKDDASKSLNKAQRCAAHNSTEALSSISVM